jgi:mRNA-degrading endonuclease RelE of RelBE toxin-antitoxin system
VAEAFRIDLTRTACRHLQALRRFERNRVLDTIRGQLTHRPDEETRNKKLLRGNPVADWELRVQPFRVFYEVDSAGQTVRVVAVGLKRGSKLVIGGEEIEI